MRQTRWFRSRRMNFLAVPLALAACSAPLGAADPPPPPVAQLTYVDLVDLAEASSIIAKVTVKDQAALKPERAPGLAPGHARLYLETQTDRVLKSPAALGESLKYLVDVPLDSKGKPPKLKKQSLLVFAKPVPGRPGELQLVEPQSQFAYDTATEARLRAVIGELVAPDAPPTIAGVRDAISVAGNLTGESETQVFVATADGTPVSLTVIRRPGMASEWGVSWSEIVDQSARPPERGTLAWYRLACFLPRRLDRDAFLQADEAGRRRAEADYAMVLDQLGPCERTRH